MQLLITLIVCVLVSFLFSLLAKKLMLSAVVGLIVTGIIMGSSWLENIILEPNTGFILTLGCDFPEHVPMDNVKALMSFKGQVNV